MSESSAIITACDQEPIHLSGAVQPHGCLIGINLSKGTVEFASKNVSTFLKKDLKEVLGAPSDVIESILESVSAGYMQRFKTGDYLVIEAEGAGLSTILNGAEADGAEAGSGGASGAGTRSSVSGKAGTNRAGTTNAETSGADRLLSEIEATSNAQSTDELCNRMSDAMLRLTGFERVMIYKFAPDWSGTVVAESVSRNVASFLALRFPASDIPVQVRRLYTEKLLRYIPDVNAAAVQIEPVALSTALDLSQSELRSVSPIHIEYLKNMEVGASMSLSILVDGKLWGLIACHHSEALHVSRERREHCKILCQLFARLLAMHEQTSREKRRADAKNTQIALLDGLSRSENLVESLAIHETLLLELVHATGAFLNVGEDFVQFGASPSPTQARSLIAHLSFDQSGSFNSDNIKSTAGEIQFSGVLALQLSVNSNIWLLWVRPEVISEVAWAGEPVKAQSQESSESEKLHPRRSFAIWKEEVSGYSHPWTDEELASAQALGQYLRLKIDRDHVESERNRLTTAVKDSNQKLVQFVDTISHDLRSPLISIGNLAQWVEKDLGNSISGAPKDNLVLLQKRVSKMRAQLNELLDYSKAGNFRAQASTVNVEELVNSIVDDVKSANDFQFVIDELPTFTTVKAPLEHVFSNLIDNATKHSERAGTCIQIGYEDAGDFFRFYVADQGKGIPVEYLEEIFLPMRSLSNADSEGHGMGLAFVKRIVEQSGGEVSVTSALNEGSRFSFTWKKVWGGSDTDG